jgi:hypothetical protein
MRRQLIALLIGETTASHRVTVCHHTGSWKHPFHTVSVDEHALPAHSGHGDTVGACNTTAPSGKHLTPKRQEPSASEHGRGHNNEHGRGNGKSSRSHNDNRGRSKKQH